MDIQSPTASQPQAGYYEDDIDLRQYIETIFAWWREIIGITLLAALIGAAGVLVMRSTTPELYEASSVVIIARITSDINIDQTFRTSLEGAQAAGSAARRDAFVGLVSNATVAQMVIDDLGDTLPVGLRQPAALLNLVSAQYVVAAGSRNALSDLIQIRAVAGNSELAADIASAWATNYVDYINALYGRVPDEIFASVESDLARAEIEYNESQAAYEAAVADNSLATLERQIQEKSGLIDRLRTSKTEAVASLIKQYTDSRQAMVNSFLSAARDNRILALQIEQKADSEYIRQLVNAEADSRLLALQLDREARTTLFRQYVDTFIQNRQLALEKDQSARAQLFTQYVDTEITNQLEALLQEQTTKLELFQAYSRAELDGKLAVLNEQISARLETLALSYDTRRNLASLLDSARMLQAHIEQAGEEAISNNQVALLLLKIQASTVDARLTTIPRTSETPVAETTAVRDTEPVSLAFSMSDLLASDVSAEDQLADISGLIAVLETRIESLDVNIQQQSQRLFYNEEYELLDATPAQNDPLRAAIQEKYVELFNVGDLAQTAVSMNENSALSDAILARYDELFGVGSLAEQADDNWNNSELSEAIIDKYHELFSVGALATASSVISDTTPLYQFIEENYPHLFSLGSLAQLTENITVTTPLETAGTAVVDELLGLGSIEDIPGYDATAAPIDNAIAELEDDVQALRAQKESQEAQVSQLQRQRDLAQRAYETLDGKLVELTLQRTAANREVLLGAPAIPPVNPISGPSLERTTAMAGAAGFVLAILFVFIASYLGKKPLFSSADAAAST